jgi:hypothetical protein
MEEIRTIGEICAPCIDEMVLLGGSFKMGPKWMKVDSSKLNQTDNEDRANLWQRGSEE